LFFPLKESCIYFHLLLYGGQRKAAHTKMRLPYSVSDGAAGEKKSYPSVFVTHRIRKWSHIAALCTWTAIRRWITRYRNVVLHAYNVLKDITWKKKSDKLIPTTAYRLFRQGYILCSYIDSIVFVCIDP